MFDNKKIDESKKNKKLTSFLRSLSPRSEKSSRVQNRGRSRHERLIGEIISKNTEIHDPKEFLKEERKKFGLPIPRNKRFSNKFVPIIPQNAFSFIQRIDS